MTESTTPRTDAEERWAEWNGSDFKVVHVEFAQELERELAAARQSLSEESSRAAKYGALLMESLTALKHVYRAMGSPEGMRPLIERIENAALEAPK